MRTPADKALGFTYGSHPMKDARKRWKATLAFPGGAVADTVLSLTVADGEGVPVDAGEFEISGRRIAVRDGKGSVTYADFIAGIHETALWLHRKGMEPVPGGLTFE